MSKRPPLQPHQAEQGAPTHWKSLDHLAQRAEVKALLQREFPEGADTIDEPTRRTFLSLMGATFGLMGLTGCIRRPEEHIIPYQKVPEGVIPGIPNNYASSFSHYGEAVGVVVESHEGRPTKVEGNPDHPSSLGGTLPWMQAMVLDLYDPDRVQGATIDGQPKTVDEGWNLLAGKLRDHEKDGGARLRFLLEPTTSPSVARLRQAVAKRFPKVKFHEWASVHAANCHLGAKLAFGEPLRAQVAYDRASIVVSIDSDFLFNEPGSVVATKGYARRRKVLRPTDRMNRLYVIEPGLTVTGMNADHRLRVPAGSIEDFLCALGAELQKRGVNLGSAGAKLKPNPAYDAKFMEALAGDLAATRGRGDAVVVVGVRQPPAVHALAHAINDGLGSLNRTIRFVRSDLPAVDPIADLKALVDDMNRDAVETLVVLGGNPSYSAPADVGFGPAYAKVPTRVYLAHHMDETAQASTWILPRAHDLEAWGDLRAHDNTLSVVQPLVAPLFNGKTCIEVLALAAGTPEQRGHDIVRATFHAPDTALANLLQTAPALAAPAASGSAAPAGSASAAPAASAPPSSPPAPPVALPEEAHDKTWRRALHNGVAAGTNGPFVEAKVNYDAIAGELGKRPPVTPSPTALEVTFAPDYAVQDGRFSGVAWLLELPNPVSKTVWDNTAWISPKTAIDLGLESGNVVRLTANGRSIEIPVWVIPGIADYSVQLHLGWGRKMQSRVGDGCGFDVSPLRSSNAFWFAEGVSLQKTGAEFVVVVTQEHQMLEGRPIIREATLEEWKKEPDFAEKQGFEHPPLLPIWNETHRYDGHKWGMVIDLNACTGCSACVIACQAENNIPTVGKEQVSRQREMHWLRIDRYFSGKKADGTDDIDNPKVVNQPMPCQQCENAPCENVCPVNATSHSPEGLNDMAYNRCIGTRYCLNNCPYKVRRFNFLDYHENVPETVKMVANPNVSVRMRGVMEKCTYCVQRIQAAKIAAKRDGGRKLRDGDITTACAQACPADAIVFGDLNDKGSRVARLSALQHGYHVLEELNTKPRTTYISKIRNPHPELA